MLLLLLLPAIITPAAEPKPTPLGPQQWVTNADYPAAAIAAREQGTVSFRLDVSAEGRVTGCTITGSSTSSILDSSTCGLMVRRARYNPARDATGKAIASTYNSRFRWVIPKAAVPSPGMVVTAVDLAVDGQVEKCSSDSFGGAPTGTGAKACQTMELPFQAAFLKQHAAAYRRIRFVNSISVDDRQYSGEDKGWGTLLVRSGIEIELDKNGRPTRCTPEKFVGMKPVGDPCAPIVRRIAPPSAPREATVQRVRIVSAVLGERR